MLSDGAYKTLKWVCLIAFPAIATLIGTVGQIWGIKDIELIVTTIAAVGTCLGTLIGVSQVQYNKTVGPDGIVDGAIVKDSEGVFTVEFKEPVEGLMSRKTVTLGVTDESSAS